MLAREYTREDWHARRADATRLARQDSPTEAFLHHSEDQHGNTWHTLAAQIGKMHDIQDFHMNSRGWADIAYHFVLFQYIGSRPQCRAFHGRPVSIVPAAQLAHNTGTLAICVVGNGVAEKLQRNTRYIIERLIARYPTIRTVGGHRDVVATECPGDSFYSQLDTIAKATGKRRYRHVGLHPTAGEVALPLAGLGDDIAHGGN